MLQPMPDEPNTRPTAKPVAQDPPDGFARIWLAIPDSAFRILGVAFFLGYALWQSRGYAKYFPLDNQLWRLHASNTAIDLTRRILIDLTYLLIVAGFCLRIRPVRRATDAGKIALAFVGAFWPFLPFVFGSLLALLDDELYREWQGSLWRSADETTAVLGGGALVVTGLLIEIWGYAYLVRSLSIVPEARVLKVTGPYRLVRHPIYFGQFLAQAGVWLVFTQPSLIWPLFYACFIGLQLIRTRMEDRVLEDAFGDTYLTWKNQTFWFA